ncbi:rho guanine nucleotide exchange factor 40 [Eucyclogobius newberryi]|uniref:rho guanine nucleotide exchange factor 40 n=1 Tax=Eucyclogobius newberryi TaxID=166745 RepID=UPI003B5C1A0F
MGSEAMEDCVQGALSSLYPPFESTAPPLLSQVFSVLESTYQHDSLRYLLDYFVPAKHLLNKLQQHACAQYTGCLFLHSGWPLCLGEKVVVQLSTLDWRLLRANDFYLQVVPFSTRCPRLALKCLAPGGRTVQEVLVPESQHPLVFASEWLHSVNKERGHKREVGGGLDTCLVSTCDGVVRLPWKEVVYPKFIHDPTADLMSSRGASLSDRLPSEGGCGGSSSGEIDSWSWDEEEEDDPTLARSLGSGFSRRRRSEDGLGRTSRPPHSDGDYVELLEPRLGPDGGVDNRQRYLEMHAICKTKTLPLVRRGKAFKLRRGKAYGSGSFRAAKSKDATGSKESVTPRLPLRPLEQRGKAYSSSIQDSDESDRTSKDSETLDGNRLHFDGVFRERKPGVGKERDSNGSANSDLKDGAVDATENKVTNTNAASEGQSDVSDSVFEDTDKPPGGEGVATAPKEVQFSTQSDGTAGVKCDSQSVKGSLTTQPGPCNANLTEEKAEGGKTEEPVCPMGKEVKTVGFRVPRRKRRGRGAKARARSGGRGHQRGVRAQGKAARSTLTANEKNGTEPRKAAAELATPTANDAQTDATASHDDQSAESLSNRSSDDRDPADASAGRVNGLACDDPPSLHELDPELLQSGKLKLTGTVDRLGRALVFTDASEESFSDEEAARVLACYHRITCLAAKEKGLTVLMDARRAAPSARCFDALKRFQGLAPGGLGSVLVLVDERRESPPLNLEGAEVHTVKGTDVLQQYVDKQQLLEELDGDFSHHHGDWLSFRLSLESLSERCVGVLQLLGGALRAMETQPVPDDIEAVPLSIAQHRELMSSVLVDQRLTELQRRGGAWLAGLANSSSGMAQKSPDCRAALAATSKLYDSVDDALHRLVQVSNQRGCDLDKLGRLAGLVDQLEKCDQEIERVQAQLEDFRDPPLSLSRLSLKQHKFKTFRETANELHGETLAVLGDLETWSELDWPALARVQIKLPPVRERLRDMSHCLSDCWTTLDNTQRLLSTLTEATQWCDAVSSPSPASTCPLSSLPPIPPSRFQDARSLALELGGGQLLDLWTQTVERYQRTVAQVKPRFLQTDRSHQGPAQGKPRTPSAGGGAWDGAGSESEGEWGAADGGLQSWGSLASLFRPQTCSTLKIADEKGNRKEAAGGGGAGGGAGGGKFLHNLLNPGKKSPTESLPPQKPVRRRHPSFDLQALLAPRRGAASPKPLDSPTGASSRHSPMSWLGRRTLVDPVVATGMVAASPGGWGGAGGGGCGVLIRGVEVSSKEVVDHTGSPRQHVLLSRAEREMGVTERGGTTPQSKLYLLWCRMLSSERQYVAVLKGVAETYLPLLDLFDAPPAVRGKADALFPCWATLCHFHSQYLLPAMEGALVQSLLQQDCFSKYRDQFMDYSQYIRSKPELDSPLVSHAADFFKSKLPLASPLSPLSFPHCLQAPVQRLEQYCAALEELGGINPASDSALSVLRHAQRHGDDLRASDLIVGCPMPVAERGELVRHGVLTVCGGPRRKWSGVRNVFLYQHALVFTKLKSPAPGRSAYSHKHTMKTGEMGLTQSVGDDGLRFEVWFRSRSKDLVTLQAPDRASKEAWSQDVALLLWTHAINNTELCLKESLCMGISSKLLLDATGTHATELDSTSAAGDRGHSSCSDSSSLGSQKEGEGRDPRRSTGSTGHAQVRPTTPGPMETTPSLMETTPEHG